MPDKKTHWKLMLFVLGEVARLCGSKQLKNSLEALLFVLGEAARRRGSKLLKNKAIGCSTY